MHQVQHPRWQAELFVEQLKEEVHRLGHFFGGFDDVGVARGEGIGQEPEGDHAGEVEGDDGRAHPHRLANHDFVYAAGHIFRKITLHHFGNAAGDFDVFDGAGHFGAGFGDGFAAFLGNGAGDGFHVSF